MVKSRHLFVNMENKRTIRRLELLTLPTRKKKEIRDTFCMGVCRIDFSAHTNISVYLDTLVLNRDVGVTLRVKRTTKDVSSLGPPSLCFVGWTFRSLLRPWACIFSSDCQRHTPDFRLKVDLKYHYRPTHSERSLSPWPRYPKLQPISWKWRREPVHFQKF